MYLCPYCGEYHFKKIEGYCPELWQKALEKRLNFLLDLLWKKFKESGNKPFREVLGEIVIEIVEEV